MSNVLYIFGARGRVGIGYKRLVYIYRCLQELVIVIVVVVIDEEPVFLLSLFLFLCSANANLRHHLLPMPTPTVQSSHFPIYIFFSHLFSFLSTPA